jgi:hypothetical protein
MGANKCPSLCRGDIEDEHGNPITVKKSDVTRLFSGIPVTRIIAHPIDIITSQHTENHTYHTENEKKRELIVAMYCINYTPSINK